MDKKLYNQINWSDVEEITYAESDNPHRVLAPKTVGKSTLYQAFFPGAKKVVLSYTRKDKPQSVKNMELCDEAGFFAALIGHKPVSYCYHVTDAKGVTSVVSDPYGYAPMTKAEDINAYDEGVCYNSFEFLGAHIRTVDKITGVLFCVYAPNAMRVSVVGDFNEWNDGAHQMRKLYGKVFELFIPCAKEGDCYKYSVKLNDGSVFLKSDPYAFSKKSSPDTASIITNIGQIKWQDKGFIVKRVQSANAKNTTICIRNLSNRETADLIHHMDLSTISKNRDAISAGFSLESTKNEEDIVEIEDKIGKSKVLHENLYNPSDILTDLSTNSYSHIFMPLIMGSLSERNDDLVTYSYYAPDAAFGSPKDAAALIDTLHRLGIGVILEWAPSEFDPSTEGLSCFDGTCLFEHLDVRRGYFPKRGTKLFNYTSKAVTNFLLSNALFWIKYYHADGIMIKGLSSMLYVDYDKQIGQWLPNADGGTQNSDAIEFIKHFNSVIHKQCKGVITIAKQDVSFDKLTHELEFDGLGFDLCVDLNFTKELKNYLSLDPILRSGHHGALTASTGYAYGERYLLPIQFRQQDMYGNDFDRYANLRAAISYAFTHPGKKLMDDVVNVIENQTEDQTEDQTENQIQNKAEETGIKKCVQAMLKLYTTKPALSGKDEEKEGFTWIKQNAYNESVLVFIRNGEKAEDLLIVAVNFSGALWDDFLIGVPLFGKYKEIFNTDSTDFGGKGRINVKSKTARLSESDGMPYSMKLSLAPLSLSILEYAPFTQKELDMLEEKKKKQEKSAHDKEIKAQQLRQEKAKKKEELKRIKDELSRELKQKLAQAKAKL